MSAEIEYQQLLLPNPNKMFSNTYRPIVQGLHEKDMFQDETGLILTHEGSKVLSNINRMDHNDGSPASQKEENNIFARYSKELGISSRKKTWKLVNSEYLAFRTRRERLMYSQNEERKFARDNGSSWQLPLQEHVVFKVQSVEDVPTKTEPIRVAPDSPTQVSFLDTLPVNRNPVDKAA